jgi:threonyl-tRNA synthetase
MKINKDLNKVASILLAKSIKDLYPNAILADVEVGDQMANESGFSCSFSCPERVSINDLPKIMKQMKKNIDSNFLIKYVAVSQNEALNIFKNNKYKSELINDGKQNKVDLIYFGDQYVDLCEKNSIAKLSAIKAYELNNVGGVY